MSAHPTITKAVRLIALDNGCVNRIDGDPTDEAVALLEREMRGDFLDRVEAELSLLSDEALDTACSGEETERAAIGLSIDAESLLATAFDALGEVRT